MPSQTKPSQNYRIVLIAVPILLTLAAVTTFLLVVLNNTRDAVLRDQARATATHWSMFFRSQVPDLAGAFRSGTVSPEQTQAIADGVLSGDVFRFKMFSLEGRLFFESEAENVVLPDNDQIINATALSVLQSGLENITLYSSAPNAPGPLHYAEAYVPVFSETGAIIGVMEIYTDTTLAHQELSHHFTLMLWLIPLVCGIVFIVPSTAVLLMQFEAAKREETLRATRLDTLTGVLSRAAFEEEATRCLNSSALYGKTTGILFVDMDRFKAINDTMGHAAGDAYLRFIADTLLENIRPDDILGRFGGDEFILLLPGIEGDALLQKGQELAAAARKERSAGDQTYRGSLSIGAYAAKPGESFEAALHKADLALYEAKSAGRDQAHLYRPETTGQTGQADSAA